MINDLNVSYLNRCIQLKRVPHSILLAGPSHSPKEECALQFAHQLLEDTGQPPDLYTYRPEGKLGLHLMETMREFREEVYLPPYQHSRKVFILFDAERMQTASANALLKTFEEPLKTSIIILVSTFPEKILPTVRSRCQILYFQGKSQNQFPIQEQLLEILLCLRTCDHFSLLEKIAVMAKHLEEEIKEAGLELEKQEAETAQIRAMREKEGEGQEAMRLLYMTESIWIAVLSWYRDLHALQVKALPEHLFYPQEQEALKRCSQQGALPSLEAMSALVLQAKRALERSAPLKHVLESFFLAVSK